MIKKKTKKNLRFHFRGFARLLNLLTGLLPWNSECPSVTQPDGDGDNCPAFEHRCICMSHITQLSPRVQRLTNGNGYEQTKDTNCAQHSDLILWVRLTVQSMQVRSCLLGPLDAGGGEAWGGPRCWRPEREMAFLKTTRQQKNVSPAINKRCRNPPRRTGLAAEGSRLRDHLERASIIHGVRARFGGRSCRYWVEEKREQLGGETASSTLGWRRQICCVRGWVSNRLSYSPPVAFFPSSGGIFNPRTLIKKYPWGCFVVLLPHECTFKDLLNTCITWILCLFVQNLQPNWFIFIKLYLSSL